MVPKRRAKKEAGDGKTEKAPHKKRKAPLRSLRDKTPAGIVKRHWWHKKDFPSVISTYSKVFISRDLREGMRQCVEEGPYFQSAGLKDMQDIHGKKWHLSKLLIIFCWYGMDQWELLGKRRAHKKGFSLHRFAYKLQKFALFHDLKSEFFNGEPSVIALVTKELQEMRDSGAEERMVIWTLYGKPEAHTVKHKKRKTRAEQKPAPVQWPSIFETAKAAAKPKQWIWPARKGKERKQGYRGPTPGPILGDYWDDWTQQWVTDRKLQVLMPPIAEHPEF